MEASFPTVEAIYEIESRQDEVLRKLDELEKRIAQTLVQFGDQRLIKVAAGVQEATSEAIPPAKAA